MTAWEVHALLRAQNVAFRSGNSVTYTGENIWEETSERKKKEVSKTRKMVLYFY